MRPAEQLSQAAGLLIDQLSNDNISNILSEPIIILSAPRSGSNLLFETLTQLDGFYSIGGESHIIFATMPHLRFENSQFDSACLTEQHADQKTAELFRAGLLYLARNHLQQPVINQAFLNQPRKIKLIEKTPRNALNVPFINKIFPNAKYIYLHRNPAENIASIATAWENGLETGRFSTYPQLPGWDRKTWCFLLPRGWRKQKTKPLLEIAAFQWLESNLSIINALSKIEQSRQLCIDYRSLVSEPQMEINRIAYFSGINLTAEKQLPQQLPLSKTTLTPPDPNKWKQDEVTINRLLEVHAEKIAGIKAYSSEFY